MGKSQKQPEHEDKESYFTSRSSTNPSSSKAEMGEGESSEAKEKLARASSKPSKLSQGQDGVTRQNVVRAKEVVAEPLPVPAFTSAVPLPVLPVSYVEQNAVNVYLSTNGTHAARVAAIESEAAQMRAMRERAE
jgi:hypothetical protein